MAASPPEATEIAEKSGDRRPGKGGRKSVEADANKARTSRAVLDTDHDTPRYVTRPRYAGCDPQPVNEMRLPASDGPSPVVWVEAGDEAPPKPKRHRAGTAVVYADTGATFAKSIREAAAKLKITHPTAMRLMAGGELRHSGRVLRSVLDPLIREWRGTGGGL